ncbi:MAG: hypothetical protein FVQ80_09885 [Planctomycetes bacterium]|nr:hypothetical protein [Planctomycetota bacterium]
MILRAISFNKEIYNAPLKKQEGKAEMNIELYIPPSDIPQNISSGYIKDKDILFITFDYSMQEKPKKLFEKNNISFFIGASSSKPLRIEICNLSKQAINRVRLTHIIKHDLSNLIGSEIEELTNLRKRTNLEYADEVLKENAEELALSFS